MVERKLTRESALSAVRDAAWANGIGIAHGAVFTFTIATDVPLSIKALTFIGLIAAGANGARRSTQENQAMGEFNGIEFQTQP